MQAWHISVLLPARNEEALLPDCLRSLLRARSRLPFHATSSLIVAVDRSTDRTGEIAERMLKTAGTVVYSHAGVVGEARSLAAAAALQRQDVQDVYHWLANTDADCVVPDDWLLQNLTLAKEGVEAAAGVVDVNDFSEHGPEVPSRFRQTYLIGKDGTHSHIHGANLGVRADAYKRAGGWKPLTTAEDHDLWQRLQAQGARTLSTTRLRVSTSGRRVGRAPAGFAAALAAHNENAA